MEGLQWPPYGVYIGDLEPKTPQGYISPNGASRNCLSNGSFAGIWFAEGLGFRICREFVRTRRPVRGSSQNCGLLEISSMAGHWLFGISMGPSVWKLQMFM